MGVIEPIGGPASSPYLAPRGISSEDRLDSFDCGKPPLNDYLREHALTNEGKTARTYVILSSAGEVAAYFSLATGSVLREKVPGKVRHGLPNPTPIMVLGRLAVDLRHERRGLGKAMLRQALLKTAEVSKIAGLRALIVHAIDDDALNFYVRQNVGFQIFPSGGKTLFLPVETILAAL